PKEVFELNKPKVQNENNEKSIDEQTVNENTEQSLVEFEGLFNKEQKQKEGTQSDVRQEAQENVPVVKKDDIDIVPKEDKEVDVDLNSNFDDKDKQLRRQDAVNEEHPKRTDVNKQNKSTSQLDIKKILLVGVVGLLALTVMVFGLGW